MSPMLRSLLRAEAAEGIAVAVAAVVGIVVVAAEAVEAPSAEAGEVEAAPSAGVAEVVAALSAGVVVPPSEAESALQTLAVEHRVVAT
jgi:hypothetical protein